MGTNHARVLSESADARLSVVVDPDARRARALADQVGCRWSTSADDLGDSRAAVVATPPETHTPLAVSLLGRGLPVLVEKPLAMSVDDVQAILIASEATGVPVAGGFVERFNPVVRTAQELLDDVPIHVLSVRHSPPNPRATSSVVHDLLIHDIDLALRLVGDAIGSVTGATWSPPGSAVDEVADATIRFAGGALATLSASRAGQRKVRNLSISTPTQLVELDLLRQDVTVYRHLAHDAGQGYRAETAIDIPFVRQAGEPLALQLRHFVALANGDLDAAAERAALLPPHVVAAALPDRTGSAEGRVPQPRPAAAAVPSAAA
jgi:predicted dehydrogenase